jgi:hypothetical protein
MRHALFWWRMLDSLWWVRGGMWCFDGPLFWLGQVGHEGLDEGGDGWFAGFDGGFVALVAEGFAGDGADGGEDDAGWEGQVGGFEEGAEVAGCRCAGEGDGVGVVLG